MKRILFIATTNLYERSGGALATLAYYNAVKKLYGNNVDLAVPEECGYGIYENAIKIAKRNIFFSLCMTFRGRFHRNRDFFRKFLKEKGSEYGTVIINGSFYAGDMVKKFQCYNIKVVVIHHNYEPEYHIDNRTLPSLFGLTPYFVIKQERNAYKYADLNVFLTKADIELLKQHYGKSKRHPFLLGVFEPDNEEPRNDVTSTASKDKRKTIVITGSLNSVQTIKGIMEFKERYFPIIRQRYPEWKIVIAGRNPDGSIKQFCDENKDVITLIPNPEDIDKVISMGSVFLCPTHVGGGLKLRLMDGLKNGLPVIVHSVSARGYDLFFDEPFFKIYDDEMSFEKGIVDLIESLGDNKIDNNNIKKLYNTTFSFEAGCKRIESMMNSITNS